MYISSWVFGQSIPSSILTYAQPSSLLPFHSSLFSLPPLKTIDKNNNAARAQCPLLLNIYHCLCLLGLVPSRWFLNLISTAVFQHPSLSKQCLYFFLGQKGKEKRTFLSTQDFRFTLLSSFLSFACSGAISLYRAIIAVSLVSLAAFFTHTDTQRTPFHKPYNGRAK